LHIYAITQYRTRTSKKVPFSDNGDGSRLLKAFPYFIKKYENAFRRREPSPLSENGTFFEVLVRYCVIA